MVDSGTTTTVRGGLLPGSTKEQGVVYIPSWNIYRQNELTVEKIVNFKRNVYGKGLELKQKNLIFSGPVKIKVYDQNMNVDENLQQHLTLMSSTPEFDLQEAIIQRFEDSIWWGPSVFNDVWVKRGNELVLEKLTHMPTSSFKVCPSNRKVYNFLLQGITLDPNGELEIYQTINTSPQKLDIKNFFVVLDDTEDQLCADPFIMPLAPVIEMLSFSWNSEMALVNRSGSPVFFIKITEPQPASDLNGNVSDVDYANLVMSNWDQNQAYPLRSNMEIVVPNFGDNKVSIDVIQALQYVLIDYSSPAGFLGAGKDGSLIKGSALPEARVLNSYIVGWHAKLTKPFVPLYQKYLAANGYKGYTVELELPITDIEDKTLALEQAKEGRASRVMHPNEFRERIDCEGCNDKELLKIAALWGQIDSAYGESAPKPPAPVIPSDPILPPEDETPPEKDAAPEDGDKEPPKEEPPKEDEAKEQLEKLAKAMALTREVFDEETAN